MDLNNPLYTLFFCDVKKSLENLILDTSFHGLKESFEDYQTLLDFDAMYMLSDRETLPCAIQVLSTELFVSTFGFSSKRVTINVTHLSGFSQALPNIQSALSTIAKSYNMTIEFIT